jgi:hypothetical protein
LPRAMRRRANRPSSPECRPDAVGKYSRRLLTSYAD